MGGGWGNAMSFTFKYFYTRTIVYTNSATTLLTFVGQSHNSSNKCKYGWKLHKNEHK